MKRGRGLFAAAFGATVDDGAGSGDGSNPVALPPPVPMRAVLSAESRDAARRRFPAGLPAHLLTGPAQRRPEIALRRPFLSGPPALADLVRILEAQEKGQFRRSDALPWFEPHLPEIRTWGTNTWCAFGLQTIVAGDSHSPIGQGSRPFIGCGWPPFAYRLGSRRPALRRLISCGWPPFPHRLGSEPSQCVGNAAQKGGSGLAKYAIRTTSVVRASPCDLARAVPRNTAIFSNCLSVTTRTWTLPSFGT